MVFRNSCELPTYTYQARETNQNTNINTIFFASSINKFIAKVHIYEELSAETLIYYKFSFLIFCK